MSVVGLLARTQTIGMCVINELVAQSACTPPHMWWKLYWNCCLQAISFANLVLVLENGHIRYFGKPSGMDSSLLGIGLTWQAQIAPSDCWPSEQSLLDKPNVPLENSQKIGGTTNPDSWTRSQVHIRENVFSGHRKSNKPKSMTTKKPTKKGMMSTQRKYWHQN